MFFLFKSENFIFVAYIQNAFFRKTYLHSFTVPDNYVSANVFFLHPINMQFRKIRKIPYENFQRRYNLSTIILIIVLKGFARFLIEIV